MASDVRSDAPPQPDAEGAEDPLLTRLRALRESLPASARKARYRFEEMERRLSWLEGHGDFPSTT